MILLYLYVLVNPISFAICNLPSLTFDPKKSIIWGPGLTSQFKMPVRYFFIQLVDFNGNK